MSAYQHSYTLSAKGALHTGVGEQVERQGLAQPAGQGRARHRPLHGRAPAAGEILLSLVASGTCIMPELACYGKARACSSSCGSISKCYSQSQQCRSGCTQGLTSVPDGWGLSKSSKRAFLILYGM